ncbi:hypothetical protein BH10BAC3_BH10BAC3_27110 [soil metagenome]
MIRMFLRKNKYVYGLAGVLIMFVVLNACSYTSKATKKMLSEARNHPYDLVVVPGVPLENGKWSKVMKARVYWSKYLYDQGIAKNIMYSGSAVYTPYYEAEVMAMYAAALGIDTAHIFTEIKAEHSTENIYYSYKKAVKLGFKNIALASDPFQTKMLDKYARKYVDDKIGLIPMVLDTMRIIEPSMQDPEINYEQAAANDFIALPKRESFWKRFKGTRGGNVDITAYQ